MFRILPLLLLMHNIEQNPTCLGPCFGSRCPPAMVCIRGECCDEPYATTQEATTTTLLTTPLPEITSKSTIQPPETNFKLNRLITPVPPVSLTAYPLTQSPFNRQIESRVKPRCVDVSPSCYSIRHLCYNIIYEVVMVKNCAHSCNRCHSYPSTQHSLTQNTCNGVDYGKNCAALKHLCSNASYTKFLHRVCYKTCFCS